ncbi:aspartyl/asparaginyl beta-hydroxylase domain-containing protein [Streptomyces rishiriensis]|uniref:aspartyl/asparaginyl beta-hydroxylase domain-containing protein n=1 Tax=Streptomyces rishiriensis TaxID=68264 RepID=UPI00340C5AB3
MRTRLLGKLDLDQARLSKDLERSADFRYSEPYMEFNFGRPWKSLMVWAPGGEVGDDIIAHYDATSASGVTAYGEQLPYIREIIEKNFSIENVTFARLAEVSDMVIVPHRDYVELTDPVTRRRAAHRLHVSLTTTEDCLFTEEDVVYRMNSGEVWFLDAGKLHGAGVLSTTRRVHLILDLADVSQDEMLRFDAVPSVGIPEPSIRRRPPLSDREQQAILALASVVDMDNLSEVFALVIKKSYRRAGGPDFVWSTMADIARRSKDEAIIAKIAEWYRHCVQERVE